jgi:hypothetical protein
MNGEPRVKGVAFRTVDTIFAQLRGDGDRDQARTLMRPEVRDAFASGLVLPASWYPIDWYKDMLRAFRAAGGGSLEVIRAIGQRAAQHDMAGLHKQLFVRVVSPQLLLTRSSRLFNTYYEHGNFEVAESRKGHVRVRCSNCLGWDQNMWTELIGSAGALLTMAGAQDVVLRITAGGKDGDSDMEAVAYWH